MNLRNWSGYFGPLIIFTIHCYWDLLYLPYIVTGICNCLFTMLDRVPESIIRTQMGWQLKGYPYNGVQLMSYSLLQYLR